jgi:deoxycytidylate deaminase
MPVLGLVGRPHLQQIFVRHLLEHRSPTTYGSWAYALAQLADYEQSDNEDVLERAERDWLRQPSSRHLLVPLPIYQMPTACPPPHHQCQCQCQQCHQCYHCHQRLLEMFATRPTFALIYLVGSKDDAVCLDLSERALFTVIFDVGDVQAWPVNQLDPSIGLINKGDMVDKDGLIDKDSPQRKDKLLDRSIETLLRELDLLCPSWFRPQWDAYFMEMARLAASRSNCCRRRVGAVLVSVDRSVVATGYNGTPRGLRNCQDGGCSRCQGSSRCGLGLASCLCLHAEENALLEAGRGRAIHGILYCTLAPCLQCCKKIVQAGVQRVVYAREYSVEHDSKQVFRDAGIALDKFVYRQRLYRLSHFCPSPSAMGDLSATDADRQPSAVLVQQAVAEPLDPPTTPRQHPEPIVRSPAQMPQLSEEDNPFQPLDLTHALMSARIH